MEELLHEPQLSVTADERRLESACPERALGACDHPQGAPEENGLGFSLQLVLAGVVVGDRGLRGALGRIADEHGAGLCSALDARGGVDEIACDHALALGGERYGCLAAEHSGARVQAGIECW